MNKTPDNRDYEDLFRVYTESSCAFNKKVKDDDEEKDEDETVKEELEEDEEEETVEEGVFDRVKDRVGSAKDAVKGGFETFKTGKGQGFNKKYESGKRQRMLKRHMDRIDKTLSDLATDAVKLGLMDDNEAEGVAEKISRMVKKEFRSENYGKDF